MTDDMTTEDKLRARIAELDEEIEEIEDDLAGMEVAARLEYQVLEGFIEVEETPDGDFTLHPVANESIHEPLYSR